CLAPFSNGLAFNTSLLPVLLAGAALHVFAGLPVAGHVAARLARAGITRLVAFPALYDALIKLDGVRPAGLPALRRAVSAAAPATSGRSRTAACSWPGGTARSSTSPGAISIRRRSRPCSWGFQACATPSSSPTALPAAPTSSTPC